MIKTHQRALLSSLLVCSALSYHFLSTRLTGFLGRTDGLRDVDVVGGVSGNGGNRIRALHTLRLSKRV